MMMDTLTALLSVYGPSGQENAVVELVKTLLKGKADSFRVDAMGNLIAEKQGQPGGKRIMLSAHMDQIGLAVTAIEKEGFLRVTPVGGISVEMSRTRAVVFGNGTRGVTVCQPTEGKAETRHLFVDIGAESAEEARKSVQVGDVCVSVPVISKLGEHRVSAPAMDDRCACALLCELMMALENPRNTVIAVFSSQEEVGCRGAHTAAFAIDPDLGVAIDVTGWGDTPETRLPEIILGKGAAVKFMDRGMIATPAVRDALIAAAERANAPYQREVLPYGSTDAAAIQHARGGIPAGTLSLPCRYVHSACEVIDMRDMDSALVILKEFVNGEF